MNEKELKEFDKWLAKLIKKNGVTKYQNYDINKNTISGNSYGR